MRDGCAVVLAGGESRRFGSDKALARFRGEPLLAHLLREVCARGFAQVALAAKEPGKYAALAGEIARAAARPIELLEDLRPVQTPLAGLCAGLEASRHALVFACAADMPFAADAALLDALFAAAPGHDAVVPVAGGSLQPLCALWRRDPCLAAGGPLLDGPRTVGPRALFALVRTQELLWPDPRPFLDADTREMLRDLEA